MFTNNKIGAHIIPNALEFPEGVKKVVVVSIDDARVIAPAGSSWDSWFDSECVTSDFMDEREQPVDQEGESF
ncbi:MAG: type II toxin-antitoxin system VapB family antitoxin [Candidatus Reddybacter sp.]